MADHHSTSEFSTKKKIISNLVKKGLRKKGKNDTIHTDDLDHLQPIIDKLIKHIELNGIRREGILRVSGSITDIHQLRGLLLKDANTVDLTKYDIHTVAGVFKMLIRDLSEPLCTFAKYEDFVKAVAIEDESTRISIVRAIVASLPMANQHILYSLMSIAFKIVENSEVTKMDAHNVAVVLAPTILRPKVETTQTMLNDANSVISITRDILKNYTMVFDSVHDKKTAVNNNNYKKMSMKGTIVLSDAQQELYEKQITDLREKLDQQSALYDQLSKECIETQETVEQLERQLEAETSKYATLQTQFNELTKQKEDLMITLTQGTSANMKWEAKYKESQNQLKQEQLAAELARQQMKQVQQLGEKKDKELLELRAEVKELRNQQQQFDKTSQEIILLRDQMNTLRITLSETQQSLKDKEQEVAKLSKSQSPAADNNAVKVTASPGVKGRVNAFQSNSTDAKSPEVEKVKAELEAEQRKREKEFEAKIASLQKQLQDLSSPASKPVNNNYAAVSKAPPLSKPSPPSNPALKTSAAALQAKAIASSGSPVAASPTMTAQQKEVKELKEQLLSWMIVSLKLELLFRGEHVQPLDHEELLLEITQQAITFELWPSLIMSKLIPPLDDDTRNRSTSGPPSRFNSLRGSRFQ